MIDAILKNAGLSHKLFEAGFFYGDLENDFGFTSKSLKKLGVTDRELRSGSYQERIHPDDRPTYDSLWQRVNDGWDDELYVEYRLSDENGGWHWVETHAVVIDRREDGSIGEIVGTDRIISGRKNTEEYLKQQLRDVQRKFEITESVIQAGTEVATDLELNTSLDQSIERLAAIVDFDRCDVYTFDGSNRELIHTRPIMASENIPPCEALCEELRDSAYPIIKDDIGAGYAYRSWMGVPMRVQDRYVGAIYLWNERPAAFRGTDLYPVTAFASILGVAVFNHQFYKRTVSELESDALTGFLTRRSFDRDAPLVWRELLEAYPFNAVLMIDIDHFKSINDTYGHGIGDVVIREVAGEIRNSLRKDDLLGRYGGEEFIAILPNADSAAAERSAERVRHVCESLVVQPLSHSITVSVGVIVVDGRSDAPMALVDVIDRADAALYRAKREGRNRVVSTGLYLASPSIDSL